MAAINALASRLTGVAPLSVFFDTILTAGVAQPPTVLGREEYADFEYTWGFDDTDSGLWAISGKSKNSAYGHVASHVFESAGTYVVTVDITDGDTVNESHDVTITVTDPDTVYSGTNTVCMSSTGNFTGCPAGATQDTTTVFSDITTHLGTNKRILLCRGDSWSETGVLAIGGTGMTIGAYGAGASPDERGIFTNAPLINASGTQTHPFELDGSTDVRIMDLEIANTGTCQDAFNGSTDLSNILLLRNKVYDFEWSGLRIINYDVDDHEYVSIIDNDFDDNDGYQLFLGGTLMTIAGNRLRDSKTTHIMRMWQAYKSVIAHNELSGSSYTNSQGRHALKLHGPTTAVLADTGPQGLTNPTKYVIIADNLIGQCPPWPLAIGPQNGLVGTDENLTDILVENNRLYSEYGTPSPTSPQLSVHVALWTSYSTVRNNVMIGDGGAGTYTGVFVGQRGYEDAPVGNRIYNNTIYKNEIPTAGDSSTGITITADATDTIARNNLIHFHTDTTTRVAVTDGGTTSTVSNDLLTDASLLVDPDNVTYLSKDFRQTASSPSLEGGIAVPVFRDFDDNVRTVTIIDQGAFEYGSAANVSLTVAGVWEPGVWDTSVWKAGVWDETPTDVTAPVLSSPTGTETGATTASGTVTTDEGNGTLYFIATENATETAGTIKAGSSQAVTGTGSQAVSVSGLTPETTYYLHYVHDDASSNESNVVNSSSFTTEVAPAGLAVYEQITGLSTAKSTSVPIGYKKAAIIHCSGQAIRWRDDGVAPTANVGMHLPIGQPLVYNGNLHALQFIEVVAGATVDIKYEE